jgi:hypothetical protein
LVPPDRRRQLLLRGHRQHAVVAHGLACRLSWTLAGLAVVNPRSYRRRLRGLRGDVRDASPLARPASASGRGCKQRPVPAPQPLLLGAERGLKRRALRAASRGQRSLPRADRNGQVKPVFSDWDWARSPRSVDRNIRWRGDREVTLQATKQIIFNVAYALEEILALCACRIVNSTNRTASACADCCT